MTEDFQFGFLEMIRKVSYLSTSLKQKSPRKARA